MLEQYFSHIQDRDKEAYIYAPNPRYTSRSQTPGLGKYKIMG